MNWPKNRYCNNTVNYSRIKTNEVIVGDIAIGAQNPIRVQSMTTTDTMDTSASVQQVISLIKAGSELIRLTAPSIKDAKNLYNIKNILLKKGYNHPLIADIHFTPNAAIEAAKIVEKVRINPGNYTDKKRFQTYNYSPTQYKDELKRIEDKFVPLIEVCKTYGTAMRIGTNHGSLSDRIMSQYGDTPLGMVESALEFVRVCEKHHFNQIILSMKASNPIIMIQAYRLLVNKMRQENMYYPLHLGVTEAGEGDDGRIKSAIGIGSLLMDGIGDTIRVSLTEAPEKEIPIAKLITNYVDNKKKHAIIEDVKINPIPAFTYSKRKTHTIFNIGGTNSPIVMANFSRKNKIDIESLLLVGYRYSSTLDKWTISDAACDYIFLGDNDISFDIPGTLRIIYNYKTWKSHKKGYPLLSVEDYLLYSEFSDQLNIVDMSLNDLNPLLIEKLKNDLTVVLLIKTDHINSIAEQRKIFIELINNNILSPVIISRSYHELSINTLQIETSIDMGSLLLDGLGDGIFLTANRLGDREINKLGFDILQATRTRISKTEYISCPSCGRTLFDLEETTAKIRSATGHLKGLKIGVMGCIVNGPGEMADADYGYVGTGPGKISLYKQKEVVKKNIPTQQAINELISLIKEHGDWVD
ncbi:MAG: 4-hydroxy-3-methylbut-2-en-1-yl diphosphate synthase [Flavobacteriales bacterium]|nr:4-hydroxy-3-methylbut-2-en-1-yl diphosphate synthase [Flavobacteriales bacterium]